MFEFEISLFEFSTTVREINKHIQIRIFLLINQILLKLYQMFLELYIIMAEGKHNTL